VAHKERNLNMYPTHSNLVKGRIAVLSPVAPQAHLPAAVCEQCGMHLCVGTLQWAGTCNLSMGLSRSLSNIWFLRPT